MYRVPTILINGVEIDTFKDEVIEITETVKQLSDIEKVFTEYSQSFNIPATPTNNNLLKHYYDYNIKNPLDARKKVKAQLKLDGFDYLDGWIRVESVAMEWQKPISYNITFFGNLVNLAEKFGEDNLSDLNLNAYTHDISNFNMPVLLTTGMFNEAIIYPQISRYRRWFYSTDPSKNINNEELLNVYYNIPNYDEYKPAIKVNKLVEAIESKYQLKLNGYLKDSALENLYMWLNKNDGELLQGASNWQFIEWGGTVNQNQIGEMTIAVYGANGEDLQDHNVSIRLHDAVTNTVIQQVDNATVLFSPYPGFDRDVWVSVLINKKLAVKVDLVFWSPLTRVTSPTYDFYPIIKVSEQFAEMTVKDFISGLVKMFNLIIVSDDGINFELTPLQQWYNQGKTHDLTDSIQFDEYSINRPKIFNELEFKWEESDTVLYQQFKTLFGYNWGDSYYKVTDEDGKQVEGEKYTIEVPFQQSVYERFVDDYTGNVINRQWAEGKGLQNHLFFSIKRGNRFEPSKVNTSSTLNQILLAFDSEIEEYSRTENYNSLFALYYNRFISSVFSIYRKEKEINAILPNNLLTNIELNDKIIIDFKKFIIEEMNTNLLTGETKFKLVNDLL